MDRPDVQNNVLVGVTVVGAAALFWWFRPKGPAQRPIRSKDTVYLHVAKPNKFLGLFSPDVWCLKLETWLRIAGIKHETLRAETAKKYSPDGTLPFIEYNGAYIPNHREIVDFLCRATNANPDASLSPAQRAIGYLVERLIENSTDKLLLEHDRLVHPVIVRHDILISLPSVTWLIPNLMLNPLVSYVVRRREKAFHLDPEKRKRLVKADLQAISDILGTNEYITGASKPSSADATVYAFLVNALDSYVKDEPLARWMDTLNGGNLQGYITRVRATLWKDWRSAQEIVQFRAGS